jgi:hypothetical protein
VKRYYKCSNPACGVTVNEKKALERGNGCKCGGRTPRVLKCPMCGGILGRVSTEDNDITRADGSNIKSKKVS